MLTNCSSDNGNYGESNIFTSKAFIREQNTMVSSGVYGYEVLYFEDNKNGTAFYVDKNHNVLVSQSPIHFTFWRSKDVLEIAYHYSNGSVESYLYNIKSSRSFEMTRNDKRRSYVYDPLIHL